MPPSLWSSAWNLLDQRGRGENIGDGGGEEEKLQRMRMRGLVRREVEQVGGQEIREEVL